MKKLFVVFMIALMSIVSVAADVLTHVDNDLELRKVSGTVYSTPDINSPGVEGATIYVACGDEYSEDIAVTTNVDGYFVYVFTNCHSDYVTAGPSMADAKTAVWMESGSSIIDFNSDIDFNVPEFTTIGAALALVGAGYVAYKKRN